MILQIFHKNQFKKIDTTTMKFIRA